MASYDETSIRSKSPIESIRRFPGLYFCDPQQGVQVWARHSLEAVSNKLEQGRGSTLAVRLHVDGSCEVEDDVPELPWAPAKAEGTPIERLEQATNYLAAGRLGNASLTMLRAAGSRLEILARHRGEDLALIYVDQLLVSRSRADLHDAEPLDHEGMRVRFWPDPAIFEHRRFDASVLAELVESIAGANPGVRSSLEDRRSERTWAFEYPRGLLDWLDAMTPDPVPREPIHFIAEREGWHIEAAFRFQRSVAPSRLRVWSGPTRRIRDPDDASVHAMLRAAGIRGWALVGLILVRTRHFLPPDRRNFIAEQLALALHERLAADPDLAARLLDPPMRQR